MRNPIPIDPKVCFGKPVIRGTRVGVSLLVDNLAESDSDVELLAAYPQLQSDGLRAVAFNS